MTSMLKAFAAAAALALPAGLPALASAQDMMADAPPPPPPNDAGGRFQPDESSATPMVAAFQAPPEVRQVQDRRGSDRGGDRDRGRQGGGDRGGGDRGGERGGDRGGERWNRDTSPVTPPQQDGTRNRDRGGDGGGWNRSGDGRDRGVDGGRPDRNGQDWNRGRGRNDDRDRNQGRWDRDNNRDRNNGGWTGGQNRRNWSNDRNGRRDYGGFLSRWNQNDWRRDWNRSRSNDWWRNDRGFRGYSGFRSGFYFAPNYGYYAVPSNYWGQRWFAGQYLPSVFWRYSLSDYRTYGLGFPPPGTQWVSVDNTIYLIDSYDGYIIEVIRDAWRW